MWEFRRLVEGKFSDQHVTTLQASFLTKRLQLPGGGGRGERVTLSIWDTAGQERFHALGPIYYRDADGAVLVYDITDADSFQKVNFDIKKIIYYCHCFTAAASVVFAAGAVVCGVVAAATATADASPTAAFKVEAIASCLAAAAAAVAVQYDLPLLPLPTLKLLL